MFVAWVLEGLYYVKASLILCPFFAGIKISVNVFSRTKLTFSHQRKNFGFILDFLANQLKNVYVVKKSNS